MVAAGLTGRGLIWAFTSFHAANWHPLTWLSHMLDSQLFGAHAGGHLVVNAILHAINAVLVFAFLARATGARWQSAIVAALFALHPLHVESVAWASERKDTLSTAFGLLCLLAYIRYVAKPSWKRYSIVFVCLACGLMAKSMLVTLPVVLLLLDYWPFGRVTGRAAISGFWPLIREKLPLLFLVLPSVCITYIAQTRGGAVSGFTVEPLSWRLANALVSYAKYVGLTFFPRDLAIFYPTIHDAIPIWKCGLALVLLASISYLALKSARSRPYLIVGWLWFVITLLPVIGLVRVGGQAMADRYTYIPSIGLFTAVVFGLADVVKTFRVPRVVTSTVSGIALLVLAGLSALQVSRWRDSETLFSYVLSINPDNAVAQNNLGSALGEKGRSAEALPHFAEAVRLDPRYFDALGNMGQALFEQGNATQAVTYFERALEVRPDSARTHWQLALALESLGRNPEALRHFRDAVKLAPQDASMHANLALKLADQGHFADAFDQCQQALLLDPNLAEAHNNLGMALFGLGRREESLQEFATALRLKPDFAAARENLRRAQERMQSK